VHGATLGRPSPKPNGGARAGPVSPMLRLGDVQCRPLRTSGVACIIVYRRCAGGRDLKVSRWRGAPLRRSPYTAWRADVRPSPAVSSAGRALSLRTLVPRPPPPNVRGARRLAIIKLVWPVAASQMTMQKGSEAGAPRPAPDPVNTLCTAVMLFSVCGLIWIALTWAP